MTPAKWVRIWNERLPDVPLTLLAVTPAEAFGALRDGAADAGLVRLPVDRDDLSAIPLYTETTVVVVPKDHLFAEVEEIWASDLAEELVLHPLDDTLGWEQPPGRPANERPETTADAIDLVAAGVGVLAVPQSLARLHHRKDLTYRTLNDVPQSRVALSWPAAEEAPDLVEEFIGIVRGRTVNSTRGRRAEAQKGQKQPRKDQKPARSGGAKQGGAKQGGGPKQGGTKGGARTAGKGATARKGGTAGGAGRGKAAKPRRGRG
ncbi:Transcriptional regulator, LysR family [Streptomyces venezuelae]|uniref:LysR family substrate-binding domain-containing protein n=1 Tax=Streptomyces gardneri TaxID=66892 RepID=UPI0006BC73EA|nr:LysR family substrate-binding domain-containing protein [Streptomyces gardneri]ALO12921.1 Transcriptional regulator, LysR family [Streptomyces venezuelae]WRK41168.1 LysR family substrate-binding domain-containing protein [Streptomyces venezuelae]CUM36416.1 Transcriptional regulator, LysR family [Streptomyces venezuelae]